MKLFFIQEVEWSEIQNLYALDQVQYQLTRLESFFSLCSAMCAKSSKISGIDFNLSSEGIHANSMKALVTDMMQEARKFWFSFQVEKVTE